MGASFHEVQFPPSISLGATGGPGFHTTVLTLADGSEKRNIDWSKDRGTWDVAHGLKSQDDLNILLAFFRVRRGQAYGFRFKDWPDFNLANDAEALPVLFTTDGHTATFQLQKVYADVGGTYVRDIFKPVAGTLTLLDNGVPTGAFTVDTTTGLVTLTGPLTTGHLITGTCEFDVPVRFTTDSMVVSITDIDNFAWGQIPLMEVRDI
jgi:uncharacterized protein (TIGR02217 family)